MAYEEKEIDVVCTECGKVEKGPHKGEITTPETREHRGPGQDFYKGSPISGTTCEDCTKKKGGYEDQMERRHGPNWREKVGGSFEETERKSQEKRQHPYYRKIW